MNQKYRISLSGIFLALLLINSFVLQTSSWNVDNFNTINLVLLVISFLFGISSVFYKNTLSIIGAILTVIDLILLAVWYIGSSFGF